MNIDERADAVILSGNFAGPIGNRHRIGDLSTVHLADVEHIIDPLLPRGHVTLFSSHGGGGKTKVALTWAAHIACGLSWNGLPTQPGRTLFVSLEDPVSVVRLRLQKIARRFRLRYADLDANIEILDYSNVVKAAIAVERTYNGERDLIMTRVFDEIKAASVGFDLVIIDNASDGFHAGENARADVSQFVRHLAIEIGRSGDRHIAVLLLAHIDKAAARSGDANGNDFSGSTAWHNSTRCRVALIKGDGDALSLVHQKSNFRPLLEPIPMAWVDGLPVPSSAEAVSAAREQAAQSDADIVFDAVRAALDSGREVPVATSGPNTCYKLLQSFPELGELRNGPDSSRRVNAAMIKLQRDGRLAIEKFRNHHRKDKERWTLAQNAPNEVRQ